MTERVENKTGNAYLSVAQDRQPPAGFLILGIHVFSVIDLVFTMLHLSEGGRELNPIMAMALRNGYTAFGVIKVCLTTLGLLVLLMHIRLPRVRSFLVLLFMTYLGVFLYHLYLHFIIH
jgi:hypothetical protein